MRHRALITPLAALIAITVAGCGAPDAPADARPSVVTTTDVYGSVATAVAGDHAVVRPIITGTNGDPHEYEATPADALAVGKAAVLVANGGGYDDFAEKLMSSAGSKPALIDVSELSGLKSATPAGEEFNEHVWYHLPTVAKLADRLAADLGKADPANAATFTANAATFKAKLDGLSAKLAAIAGAHRGARIAVTEPVPGYLVDAAGLENVTPDAFAEAVELGNDPSAAVLNETLALFRTDPVKALLANPQVENAATKQVVEAATAARVPVVGVTETIPAGTADYVSWVQGEIDQLALALDRTR